MVRLTRLNGTCITLNAAHIVSVECTPNTLVTMYGGQKLMVREGEEVVCEHVRTWCQSLCPCHLRRQPTLPAEPPPSS